MMVTTQMRLVFRDFVDLQTRIVLLPRIEEEGRGAVVASFSPSQPASDDENSSPNKNAGNESKTKEEASKDDRPVEEGSSEPPAVIDTSESMEEVDLETNENDSVKKTDTSSSSMDEEDGKHFQESNPQDEANQAIEEAGSDEDKSEEIMPVESKSLTELDVLGTVLVGISKDHQSKQNDSCDLMNKDFTEILASIREAPTPIVLLLEPSSLDSADKNCLTKEVVGKAEEDDTSTESSGSECEENPAKLSPDTAPRNLFGERLSSWSSRVRATSAQLAAEAASGAASLSTKVVSAAAEASERVHRVEGTPATMKPASLPPCRMFLQQSSGEFTPIGQPPKKESCPKVSTSSVLLMRLSASEPCPSKHYKFQWYRSCDVVPSKFDDDKSRSSEKSKESEKISETGENESALSDAEVEWSMLPGATYAAYQPSATDVGHRVRCVATMSEDDDDIEEPLDSDNESTRERVETYDLPTRISADMSLFNAARQALVRGAKFGNLVGRGNAEGRSFMVHIEISRPPSSNSRKKADMASSLMIYQVSGKTAEPMHEGGDAIFNASAVSDPSQAKRFNLVFPKGLPDSASMVSALCTDGGFELEAPNRITRETLLLALGIANYKGKPADLDVTTVLYPTIASGDDSAQDISVDSIGDISVSSSNVSAMSKDGSIYSTPIGSTETPRTANYDCNDRMQQLERELYGDLKNMRIKLAKKDKVVSDLQRQLAVSEAQLQKAQTNLSSFQKDSDNSRTCLKLAERRIETHEADYKRLKGDHVRHVSSLETRIQGQAEKMAEMEKMIRSLQNEKAVLSAAVDARDGKLAKMEDLQSSVKLLKAEVSKGDALRAELNDTEKKCRNVSADLESVSRSERECREELEKTRTTVQKLNARVEEEQKKNAACQSRLGTLGTETQKLKAERNSFKQKADSLAKEVARICRNGLKISDVEKIVQDEESRRTEVSLLRAQKRKALEELELYRTAFDQSVSAQSKAGIDGEAVRALGQKAELERVISELTEYVNAKEMQLETMKQVNQSLQEELSQLSKSKMNKTDV